MPPMALTIEVPNYNEGELLDYVWPVFSWNDWNNGFTNRTNNVTPLNDNEVGFGYEACGLKAGYNRAKDGGMDSGPATWPVFCILDNERQLNGRFGDPLYSFLTFQLYRCGSPYEQGHRGEVRMGETLSIVTKGLALRRKLPQQNLHS